MRSGRSITSSVLEELTLRGVETLSMTQPNIVFVFADPVARAGDGVCGRSERPDPASTGWPARKPEPGQHHLHLRSARRTAAACSPGSTRYDARPVRQRRAARPPCGDDGQAVRRRSGLTRPTSASGTSTATAARPTSRRSAARGSSSGARWGCTHHYNHSAYYASDPAGADSDVPEFWEGYDAIAQTREAQRYVGHDRSKPFLLVLSWGRPTTRTAPTPEAFRKLYPAEKIRLRPNVPLPLSMFVPHALAGYYAHCTALGACLGDLLATLDETGLADDTLFVFTSGHGGAVGCRARQQAGAVGGIHPRAHAAPLPCALRPAAARSGARSSARPTSCPRCSALRTACSAVGRGTGLHGLPRRRAGPSDGAALIACYHPIADWWHGLGGQEYRGCTAGTPTCRSLDGPWLLFDNQADPYRTDNLVDKPSMRPSCAGAGRPAPAQAGQPRRCVPARRETLPPAGAIRWTRMETVPIPPSTPVAPLNVVLIEADQAPARWLGCYGNGAAHPHIGTLAADGCGSSTAT